MQLYEVITAQQQREFLLFPRKVYAHDPVWIEPLHADVQAVFDEKRNERLRAGKYRRWIVKDDHEVTGRIAAFVDPAYTNKGDEWPVGGVGFFECIDDFAVAKQLFDAARQWLVAQNCQAMDGPIQPGQRDKFWGLLIGGFDRRPLYGMNFHPPYYRELFERYGFQPFYKQYCYGVSSAKAWKNDKVERISQLLQHRTDYRIETLNFKEIPRFARDFTTIYNAAFSVHESAKELDEHQVLASFKKMKFVINKKLILFAYYQSKPAGFVINIPDINIYFKGFRGQLGLWQKICFLWRKTFRPSRAIVGIVYGIAPFAQDKGVDALLIRAFKNYLCSRPYDSSYELQWIGEFNKKMLLMAEQISPIKTRVLCTYRYIFDRNASFRAHPDLE